MATSKKTKPQPRRAAKKKVAKKPRRQAKAAKAKPKKVRGQKPDKLASVAKAEHVEKLPAREIVRRPKPEKPKFLNSKSANIREKGFSLMMSNWIEFAKVPLSYLTENELKRLFDAEVSGRKRWNIVNRLHSGYTTKRTKRERSELRVRCGLDG